MSGPGGVPQAQDELQLLERVFIRLGCAETDEQLQEAVSKFLPPVLLKLTSQNEGVRKKVMELLVHINKRIKNNHNIQLPVEALLLQYQDPMATSFVINFTIIYLKMGFPRLSIEKQAELVPSVLAGIESKPTSHQDSLLLMIMPVLGEVAKIAPTDPEKKRSVLGLCEKPTVSKVLYSFMFDFLLLPYGSHPSLKPADPKVEGCKVPAGLSEYGWKRVAGDSVPPSETVEVTKTGIVKFLGSGLLPEMEVALQLLIAAADSRHTVASAADTQNRQLSGVIDWNDPELVRKLYSLFLGTLVIKDRPTTKPEHKRIPSNTRIRLKLMPVLLKSREAAMQFPSCIQVTFDLLFGTSGNSNAKLKMMAVNFVHQIIFHCPEHRLSPIGAVILSALTRLVNEEKDNPKLRGSCYVAIGKLGLKLPALVNKDVSMIQTFFDAMSTEDSDTQMSVQEALGLMAPAFRQIEQANRKFIEAIVATYIEKEEKQVRLVAVQYAGEVFPHDNVATRYTLLIGAGDLKDDVAKASQAALYSAVKKANNPDLHHKRKDELLSGPILPDFMEVLMYLMDKCSIRIKSSFKVVVGDVTLPFTVAVGSEMCDYIRLCLWNSAGILPSKDMLETPQHESPKVGKYLKKVMGEGTGKKKDLVIKYVELAEKLLRASAGMQQALALLHGIGSNPTEVAPMYEKKMDWFKFLLNNTREDLRETVATIYGLVAAVLNKPDFEKAVKDLTRSMKEKQLEYQHGAGLAIGYSFARRILLARMKDPKQQFSDWRIYKDSCQLLIQQLDSPQNLLLGSGCLAIAELGRCGPLPLPDSCDGDSSEQSKLSLVTKLLSLVKSNKTSMRVRERAALAAGSLCLGDIKFPHRRVLLESFIELASEVKDVELHFTIGDALVHCALGPLSPSARDVWTVAEEDFNPLDAGVGAEELEWLVTQLTEKLSRSTHPNIKQASCLWLLSLVKHCMTQEAVQSKLSAIQDAFMGLLGDNNDLVQDAASKGIGIVYEACTEDQRDGMVNNLLDTLLGKKPQEVKKVNEETKVFQEGELGKNPVGGNMSTYKELCSLATDMGQPDLVYKFMHLANYNATWNSKKGAAFGFSTIASKAGDQLEPHLPKIIPKLYRYQFDPTPRIQQSMSAIWSALVPESTKTVDKFLPAILAELQKELTSAQWRVRESCCVGLTDLLRGRTLDDALDTLTLLWQDIFRVMDDIKESVRVAAAKTAQSLSRVSIKMCDVSIGAKAGEAAVKAILPPLLEKGLTSTVSEVRAVCLATLMKVTKSAGPLLAPHLGVLIPALLEATGEMEGQQLNYISTRLGVDQDVQEKLDSARMAASRSTPTMECVNYVLQYVDSSVLTLLVPRLVDIIRGNPSIVTRGGAAHVVTTLTHQCPLDLQAFTGKLLSAFLTGLSDRNPAVRISYAGCIGHLMRTAKESSKEKLFNKLRTGYMEKEDDASRAAVAFTFQAVNRHNPDVMKSYASSAMPIAFLAMHEEKNPTNSEVLEVWEEVWLDGTPGSEGGIRLYQTEIMDLLPQALTSNQWPVKAQAARAIGTVATKLGGTIQPAVQKRLIGLLLSGLEGRTWTGKECLLRSLADIATSGAELMMTNVKDEIDQLVEALLKECRKEKLEYRIIALESTGTIFNELKLDRFKEIYEMLAGHLPKSSDEDNKENGNNDDMEDRETSQKQLELQYGILICFGLAWPETKETAEAYLGKVVDHLETMAQNTTKKNQLAIVKCLANVLKNWKIPVDSAANQASKDSCGEIFSKIAKIISTLLLIPKYAQLRTETLQVLSQAIKLLVDSKSSDLVYLFKDEITKSLDGVIKDLGSDPNTKTTARDLKTALNNLTEEKN